MGNCICVFISYRIDCGGLIPGRVDCFFNAYSELLSSMKRHSPTEVSTSVNWESRRENIYHFKSVPGTRDHCQEEPMIRFSPYQWVLRKEKKLKRKKKRGLSMASTGHPWTLLTLIQGFLPFLWKIRESATTPAPPSYKWIWISCRLHQSFFEEPFSHNIKFILHLHTNFTASRHSKSLVHALLLAMITESDCAYTSRMTAQRRRAFP